VIVVGDCREVMAGMEPESVDAVVCDPPYGLEFMGKEWDSFKTGRSEKYAAGGDLDIEGMAERSGKGGAGPSYVNRPARRCAICGKQAWSGSPCQCAEPRWIMDNSPLVAFQAWSETWAREAYRVLKPGGHLVAFSGTRTSHRMVCAIEDAGFEVRDSLVWMYATGFNKVGYIKGAQDVWPGCGGSLKPAHEPICLARKPLIGTLVANVQAHGTGALNIDGCRIEGAPPSVPQPMFNSPTGQVYGFQAGEGRNGEMSHASGRWPANVVLSHAPDCVEVGTRRVRGATGSRGASTRIYGGGKGFTGATGEEVGYADADGMETVTAWECAPGCPVAALDAQSGERTSGTSSRPPGRRPRGMGEVGERRGDPSPNGPIYGDTGGASRYFLNISPDTTDDFYDSSWYNKGDTGESSCSVNASTATESSTPSRTMSDEGSAGSARGSADKPADARSARRTHGDTTDEAMNAGIASGASQAAERSTNSLSHGGSGSGIMDPSPPDMRFITETSTTEITIPPTSNVSPPNGTTSSMPDSERTIESLTVSRNDDARLVANTSPSTPSPSDEPGRTTDTAGHAHSHTSETGSDESEKPPSFFLTAPIDAEDWDGVRFRYQSKASRAERSAGLPEGMTNGHPTVKSVAVMQWLVRLVTPPNGTVLDPFLGSGSTGVACVREGFRFVGIEQDADYAAIAEARIAHAEAVWDCSAPVPLPDLPLFARAAD